MKATASAWIDRPVGEAKALIATPTYAPRWCQGIVEMSADQPCSVQDSMITADVLTCLCTVHTTRGVISSHR
jgi:hypothetical protein